MGEYNQAMPGYTDVWLFDGAADQYYRDDVRYCAPGVSGCPSHGAQICWVWFNKPVSTLLSKMQMSYYGMP